MLFGHTTPASIEHMNSVDAQCLVFDLTAGGEAELPDQWQHLPDGTLACRFGESDNTMSWPPPDVEAMAAQWQASGRPIPPSIAKLVEGHEAFEAVLARGELERPDRVVHDLRTVEVIVMWDDQGLTVVVGDEAEAA